MAEPQIPGLRLVPVRGRARAALTVLAFVALIAVVVVAVWPFAKSPSEATPSAPPQGGLSVAQSPAEGGQRLVVYGHSMPLGGGASDRSLGYPTLAAEATGLELVNRAQGGAYAGVSGRSMAALPPAGPSDVVVIHTGMNDIFRRGDDAVAMGRHGVRQLLTASAGAHQRIVVLECQPVSWLDTPPGTDLQEPYDAWNALLRRQAAAHGADVLDACEAWDPALYTTPPKYHPNDTGHAFIAEQLADLIARG